VKLPAVEESETASWDERWLGWPRGGCSLRFGDVGALRSLAAHLVAMYTAMAEAESAGARHVIRMRRLCHQGVGGRVMVPRGNSVPHVRIEIVKGRSLEERQQLFQAVHDALMEAFRIPDDDRTQRIVEHEPENFEIPPGGRGLPSLTLTGLLGATASDVRRSARNREDAASASIAWGRGRAPCRPGPSRQFPRIPTGPGPVGRHRR
jgi:Tautomerase enzyme